MGWFRTTSVLAASLLLLGLIASAARAQPPGGSPPPGQAPGQAPGNQPASGSRHEIALDAAIALAEKTHAVAELGGFGTPPPERIMVAVAPIGAVDRSRDELLGLLDTANNRSISLLSRLARSGLVAPEVRAALSSLGAQDHQAAVQGRPISIEAEIFLRALDDLLFREGAPPPTPVPPDPQAIANALLEANGGGMPWLLWAIIALAALAVLGLVLVVLRRRPSDPSGEGSGGTRPIEQPRGGSKLTELLEVSRRLTAATSGGDVDRAVVREAMGLVQSNAAGLVVRSGDKLVVAHESKAELLRPEGLSEGLLARVAETGQPALQVSATEPAIRYLPVALVAVPLVGGGRVDAVLVLIRASTAAFTTDEKDSLLALAPIAAAAMQSARDAAEKSLVDPLTGVGNRRRLDADLPGVLEGPQGRPTAAIMLDLDHFKSVNDTHGHPAGDALLRSIAAILRETIRPGDAVYRYGGEEFCIVLPDTDAATAASVAERVRAAISEHPFDIGEAERLPATASLGVAATHRGDADVLIANADAALYEAKQAGRDRVVVSSSE